MSARRSRRAPASHSTGSRVSAARAWADKTLVTRWCLRGDAWKGIRRGRPLVSLDARPRPLRGADCDSALTPKLGAPAAGRKEHRPPGCGEVSLALVARVAGAFLRGSCGPPDTLAAADLPSPGVVLLPVETGKDRGSGMRASITRGA